jgi:hypothetical protein
MHTAYLILLAAMFEMSTFYKCGGGVEAYNGRPCHGEQTVPLPACSSELGIVFQLFAYTTSSSPNLSDNDLRILLSFRSFITKDPSSALSSWNADGNSTSSGTGNHGLFCGWTSVTCNGNQSVSSHCHMGPGTASVGLCLQKGTEQAERGIEQLFRNSSHCYYSSSSSSLPPRASICRSQSHPPHILVLHSLSRLLCLLQTSLPLRSCTLIVVESSCSSVNRLRGVANNWYRS